MEPRSELAPSLHRCRDSHFTRQYLSKSQARLLLLAMAAQTEALSRLDVMPGRGSMARTRRARLGTTMCWWTLARARRPSRCDRVGQCVSGEGFEKCPFCVHACPTCWQGRLVGRRGRVPGMQGTGLGVTRVCAGLQAGSGAHIQVRLLGSPAPQLAGQAAGELVQAMGVEHGRPAGCSQCVSECALGRIADRRRPDRVQKTPAGAGAAASSWASPQELSLRVPDAPALPFAAAIQPLQLDKRMLAAWEAAQQTEAARAPQAPLIAQEVVGGEQDAAADADAAGHQASPADASSVAKPARALDSGGGPSRSAASAQGDAPPAPRAANAEEEDESLWVKPERMWVGASQPGSPQSSTAAAREQVPPCSAA